MTNFIGTKGLGSEAYGDPFGAGGFLHVVRALAVAGQTVRVVFDEEPVHVSAAATDDALDPSNYLFEVVSGQGEAPSSLGVDEAMVEPPALGVRDGTDERGFDVRVDRPLVVGLRFRATARNVRSALGGGLGFPYSAEFVGVVPRAGARAPSRRQDLADLANDPQTGRFVFDQTGDVDVQTGVPSLKKRVVRRAVTALRSYSFLPGYGTRARIKEPVSVAALPEIQADLAAQIRREPDAREVAVVASLVPLPGVLTLAIQVRMREEYLAVGLTVQPDGGILID